MTLSLSHHMDPIFPNRNQFVYVNSCASSLFSVTSGVPQGSVLDPLHFLIYINHLPLHLTSTVCLFADDCIIYRKIATHEDSTTLQNDINNVTEWCNLWQMSLNYYNAVDAA